MEDQGFDSCLCCGDFSQSGYTSDLNIATLLATLPGAWSTGSVLRLVGLVSIYCAVQFLSQCGNT